MSFAARIAVVLIACCPLISACAAPSPSPDEVPATHVAPEDGWVILRFDIDPEGVVHSPSVVESSPSGRFDATALKAVAKWKYEPVIVDGQAVWVRGQLVRVIFKQTDEAD